MMGRIIIGVVLFCIIFVIWGFFQDSQTTMISPEQSQGGYVNMEQPQRCSWWNSKCDEHNANAAGTNMLNAQANNYNADARLKDSQGRYIDQLTEQQKIQNQYEQAPVPTGLWANCIQPTLLCLGSLVGLYFVAQLILSIAGAKG